MDSHKNAGLTPHGRAELVRRYERGRPGQRAVAVTGLPLLRTIRPS